MTLLGLFIQFPPGTSNLSVGSRINLSHFLELSRFYNFVISSKLHGLALVIDNPKNRRLYFFREQDLGISFSKLSVTHLQRHCCDRRRPLSLGTSTQTNNYC